MKRSVLAALLIFILVQGWAQKSKKQTAPQVLFSVANRSVSTDEFSYLYRKNHQNKVEDFTKLKIDEYLSLFINFKLKVEEARSRGLDTTAVFKNEFNTYKEELRRPFLPEGKMVDSLVRLTYERLTLEVRASHILIGTKPEATPADTLEAYKKILDIKTRAQAGEDFGTLAATLSEDPSARSNQGDLGYFTALQMVYPFESAAYQGKPGEVVGPVKTRFGYHLLKIQDRKPARGEVEVSHIMIRIASENDVDRAKNIIFDIYDELKGGVAWEELCAQYSDDVSSKNTGGRLRPFGVGAMATVPEFDQVAFSLQQPGEVSDPFQTAYGWHIVRMERKIPLPSFEEIAPSLKARVQRDERVQISRQALVARLKKEYAFKENVAIKTKVFALADSSLVKGKWSVVKQPGTEVLFSIKSRSVSTNDFISYVKEQQRTSTLAPEAYLAQLYTSFVESVINQAYEDQLVRTNPDYEMLLREYYEGILLFDIMEKEVWNKASNDTIGQRAYFSEHASAYVAGERVQAEIYSSTSSENMTELSALLQKNDSIGVAEAIKARKGRLEKGIYQTNDRPVLAKVERKEGDYSVENNGMYYLVRILQLISPGPMTYEEAKASVISDYQNHLEKVWVEALAKKYPVKINEKGKQYMYKQLVRP
jgi:peptidyl-prolyl cis-trans isomerase SurA